MLSIISVPAACGEGTPGGVPGGAIPVEDDDGALDPNNDSGGGDTGVRTRGCEAFNLAYYSCYLDGPYIPPGYATTGGSSSGNGSSGGFGSDDGGPYQPPDFAAYCREFANYYAAYVGVPCANAMDDVLACIAPFACQDLDDANLEQICAGAIAAADATCPDVPVDTGDTDFPQGSTGEFTTGEFTTGDSATGDSTTG